MARAFDRPVGATRPIQFELGYTRYAEGSVLARCGETWVLCNASVEDRVPDHCLEFGRGWITAEYNMLPRSTHTRTRREGRKGDVGGRTLEIQRLIGRSLRAVVDLTKMSGFTVRLDCDVLQADGGTRTTAISGAYLALETALAKLAGDDLVSRDALQHQLGAISVGLVDDQVLVDLDYQEDSRAQVDMNLVMNSAGGLIEVQATAEGAPYSRPQLDAMIEAGSQAIEQIFALQRSVRGKPGA